MEAHDALRRIDLRWHDLRHEYASRLAERGMLLSQIRDLLGHHSIVTTERYDTQRPEALMAAAKRLDSGTTGIKQALSSRRLRVGSSGRHLLRTDRW